MRIEHTRDSPSHVRFGDVHERFVEFPPGEHVVDVDPDDAFWAAGQFADVELVAPDVPRDYDTLRRAAAFAATDAVSGNDDKRALLDWMDGLDARRRDALLTEVTDGA